MVAMLHHRIYTPITVLFIEVYILANAHPTTCPEGSTSATQVYVPALTGSTSCQILLSVGGSLAATGVIRNYTITNCNLDDYSWALGLGASVFGVLVIRRRNKL
jgi:hypothetical protein